MGIGAGMNFLHHFYARLTLARGEKSVQWIQLLVWGGLTYWAARQDRQAAL